MQIIPVIDLKDGQVVHAKRGQRDHYQAIHRNSQLTHSSQPDQVLRALLEFYPFQCLYIADLNAITGKGHHREAILQLSHEFPATEFWIDDGSQLDENPKLAMNQRQVIGTESQHTYPKASQRDYILSLDFAQHPLGLDAWFSEKRYWPKTVIAMTLTRVGSQLGPDFERLKQLMTTFPEHNWIAAGGVRDENDLERLSELGVSGVLIASALHNGALSPETIAKWQAKKYPGMPGYFQQPEILKT